MTRVPDIERLRRELGHSPRPSHKTTGQANHRRMVLGAVAVVSNLFFPGLGHLIQGRIGAAFLWGMGALFFWQVKPLLWILRIGSAVSALAFKPG